VPDAAPSASRRSTTAPPAAPDTLEFIFPERQPAELLLTDDATVVEREPVAAAVPSVAPAPATEITEVVPPPSPPPAILRGPIDEATAFTVDDATAFAMDEPPGLTVDEAGSDFDDEDDVVGEDELAEHVLGDPPAIESDLLADPVEDDEPTLADFDDEDADDEDADEPEPTIDRGRRVRVEDTMRAPAGFGTIMRAIGTAVAGFAALALTIRVAPERKPPKRSGEGV